MQKMLTLRQVTDRHGIGPNFHDAEVGDIIAGFEVEDVREVECNHANVRWRVRDLNDGDGPEVVGVCKLCGEERSKSIEDIEGVEF